MIKANSLLKLASRDRWSRRAVLHTLGMMLVGPLIFGGCSQQTSKAHTVEMISEDGEEIFKPDRLNIQSGDTVSWLLESGFHSTTAYHPDNSGHPLRIPTQATPWDSGLIRKDGEQFEVTF